MLSFPDFKFKKIITVFAMYGEHFSFKNDNILVVDSTKKVVFQDTLHGIFSVWIVGTFTITSPLLEKAKRFGVSILILNRSFRLIGFWGAKTEGNFILREKQYNFKNLNLAKYIINNKIQNQIVLLRNMRSKENELKTSIEHLQYYKDRLVDTSSIREIMGLEGSSSKLYFKHFFKKVNFKKRAPRTKIDPLNVVLDIGYTKLFYIIENLLNLYGFDLYKGFLHQTFYARKSLVCDLQEPFRPLVDRVIKNAYGLGKFKDEDFTCKNFQYFLDFDKQKHYTSWFLNDIFEYKDEIFLYIQKFYRAFMREKEAKDFPEFLL